MRLPRLRTKENRAIGLRVVAALLGFGLLFLSPALSAEWPQWRGPHADGSVAGPAREGPLPDKPSILWKRQIGGGYSGPVVSGDRVWVHSRRGGDEVVSCLGLATGQPHWRQSYSAPFHQDVSALAHGSGPYATPVLNEGRLFTFGVNSVLIAWDAVTGERLWRLDSADEFDPSSPFFGAAGSPVVWQDLVFVHLGGHTPEDIENPAHGAMVALRVSDGREMWRWSADGPAVGATPVLTEVEGQPQLVFKTNRMMVGVAPRTGKELWRIPFVVTEDNTIVTPFFVDGRLITSDADWGIGAWEIRAQGENWTLRELWRHRDVSLTMSSPVLAGGLVVGFSHLRRGQLFLLDPASGEVRWQGSSRSGEHASLISWGDEVLAFMDDGSLIIGRVEQNALHELERFQLGNSIGWSHPAVVGTRIIYRDGDELAVCLLEQP